MTGKYISGNKNNIPEKKYIPLWKHHLQQAVISDDLIDYHYQYVKEQRRI